MKHTIKRLPFIPLLFLLLIKGGAQNIKLGNWSESILVKEDTSYVKQIRVAIRKNTEAVLFPIVYDTQLEEISDIQLFIKKGSQYKQVKELTIHETDIDVDFLNSKKIKSIVIPAATEAKVTYNIICHELMYFSELVFFSYDSIDSIEYRIKMPENFRLAYDIKYKDSLKYLEIDSSKMDQVTEWQIKAIPLKVDPDPMMFFGIYKNMHMPLMRTIVVPSSHENSERAYMNDWYLDKLKARRGLDSTIIHKIDLMTLGITDPLKIIDTLYNYVRKKFKYVAIEIGMGAFVPNHVNDVFNNKQGDCKDLANFLSEILNYKGIKCHVALAATYHHITDCDFPSLCSANHLICVAYINDQPVLLDPTDPIHRPNTPVESIQERSVFIINPNGGEFFRAKGFTSEQNQIEYEIALRADTLSLDGTFSARYSGISGNFLKRSVMDLTEQERKNVAKKHFESVFGNQAIMDCRIIPQDNCVTANGKLSVKGKIFYDQKNRFLFMDFLPGIIESESRQTLLEGTYLGNTIGKKVKLVITMDKPIEKFAPIEHTYENKRASLHVRITNPSESIIVFEYEFLLDYFMVEKDNLESINETLKFFKKTINEPIVLKSKS